MSDSKLETIGVISGDESPLDEQKQNLDAAIRYAKWCVVDWDKIILRRAGKLVAIVTHTGIETYGEDDEGAEPEFVLVERNGSIEALVIDVSRESAEEAIARAGATPFDLTPRSSSETAARLMMLRGARVTTRADRDDVVVSLRWSAGERLTEMWERGPVTITEIDPEGEIATRETTIDELSISERASLYRRAQSLSGRLNILG